MRQFGARVAAVESIRPGLHVVWSDEPQLANLQSGQFAMLRCGDGLDPLLRKQLNLFRRRNGATGFLFTDAKPWGKWLAQRRPGDVVDCIAPLGCGYSLDKATRRLLLAAEGIGISAVAPLIDQALSVSVEVCVVSIGRDERSRFPAGLLPEEVEVVPATLAEAGAELGKRLAWADQLALAVGAPILRETQAQIRESGRRLAAHAIIEEKMACGVGACLGCIVRTKRGNETACVAGPVFDLMELRL
jgi:dihydroorotate dehydrogenase electron transfer subunit